MKKIFLSVFLGMLVFAPLSFAHGADYLPKDKNTSGNIVVAGPEEYKNLYVGGGSVIVNTKILGDLFAAGGSVNLAGEVEEDFFAVGGNVTISSPVMGDVRVAGGNIVINTPIAGDLLVAGGTVSLGANATVGGDMWVAGGVINITAPITGDLKVAGGEIYINSSVGGTIDAQADEKLTFGPQAVALGTIKLCGPKEAVVEPGAQVGNIEYTKVERNYNGNASGWMGGFALMKILILFVTALAVMWLFKKHLPRVLEITYGNFWRNMGVGLAIFFLTPMVAFLLMFTFVGMMLAIMLFIWYFFALMLACVFTIFTIGNFIEKWLYRKKPEVLASLSLSWKTALLGTLAGALLCLVPFVGGLVVFGIYLATLGAMVKHVKNDVL